MNCSTFKNKLNDYIEGNVTFDMKEAMETHMMNCEACRKIYEEEKRLDDSFREAFNINTSNFTSSRAAIMKSIDKNRYSQSPFNKLKYNLKRYRTNYLATVAVLALAFFSAPYVANMGRQKGAPEINRTLDIASSELAKENATQRKGFSKESGTNEAVDRSQALQQPAAQEAPSNRIMKAVDNRYMPKFIKTPTDPKADIKFGTPWKASPDGKMQVSLDGKGPNAGEEGIAEILVNDKLSNSKWLLSLTENDRQFTPMYIEWLNNESLLVIVGYGNGTVSQGGELFKLNINNASIELVYGVQNDREQVVSVKKGKNELILQMVIYKDDQMNGYTTEQRTIGFQTE
jgi:hypothetical protein